MAVSTPAEAVVVDVRAQVINDLAEGIGPVIVAIDELEAAAQSEDKARVRRAGRALFAARDRYLDPIVQRAEEGQDW